MSNASTGVFRRPAWGPIAGDPLVIDATLQAEGMTALCAVVQGLEGAARARVLSDREEWTRVAYQLAVRYEGPALESELRRVVRERLRAA